MRSVSGTRRALKWIGNGLLVVMLVWTLVPFYWMIATSLKKDKEIYGFEATLIPRQPTLSNYTRLFGTTPFVKYLRNSTIIALGNTLASLLCACLGAYALARLRFPGRGLIARGLVVSYLVPPSLLFIPLFAVLATLSLIDTHQGLILTYLGFSVPFCTWLLMGYFRTVPLELEEAALVDGCSRLGTLVRIILPQALYNSFPALLGQFVSIIKETSLGFVIGVHEFSAAAAEANNDLLVHPVQIFSLLAATYFVICFLFISLARLLERRMGGGRGGRA